MCQSEPVRGGYSQALPNFIHFVLTTLHQLAREGLNQFLEGATKGSHVAN